MTIEEGGTGGEEGAVRIERRMRIAPLRLVITRYKKV
jgi:hypothetical protein